MATIPSSPVQVTIAQVVGFVESRNWPFALRFEPTVFSRSEKDQKTIRAILYANNCSLKTAEVIYSTSWGEYQIMGFELYGDVGYSRPIAQFMAHDSEQFSAFSTLLVLDGFSELTPRDLLDDSVLIKFARAYNGQANVVQYSMRLSDALNHFGVK